MAEQIKFMKFRHVMIVDVLDKLVTGPLFFTIGENESTNMVTIEANLIPFNHRVMATDSHNGMIVRDGKGEDLPVQLRFTNRKSTTRALKAMVMLWAFWRSAISRAAAPHFTLQARKGKYIRVVAMK